MKTNRWTPATIRDEPEQAVPTTLGLTDAERSEAANIALAIIAMRRKLNQEDDAAELASLRVEWAP